MATTYTLSGSHNVIIAFLDAYSGETTGGKRAALNQLVTWAAAGGTAPTISGFFDGIATCAAGDWLLASASDPLQAMGSAEWSDPLFAPSGTKCKLLFVYNADLTNSITIKRGAANGFPFLDTAGAGTVIGPGGHFLWFDPTGVTVTSGSTDKLTIAVGGGAPLATVIGAFGP